MKRNARDRITRRSSSMGTGFTPISLPEYAERHVRANPGTDRAELRARLREALNARRNGVRCECGNLIWVIGSAEAGFGCFTCITGDSVPDQDYELEDGETDG